MDLLIDANVVIACVMGEPERDSLLKATAGRRLIAPASLPWEVCNAFSAMLKRRRINVDEALEGLRLFRQMTIELHGVDLNESLKICASLNIYAYDSYVLQCALATGAPLLTLDGGLKVAARSSGILLMEVMR